MDALVIDSLLFLEPYIIVICNTATTVPISELVAIIIFQTRDFMIITLN